MFFAASILSHFVYLVLGRVLIGNRRPTSIFYADWFIASASVYFFSWALIGYANFLTPKIPVNPFVHLVFGFLILVLAEIIRFRAPRGTRMALTDLKNLFVSFFRVNGDSIRESRIVRYFFLILITGYGYFIYKALSVPTHEYDVLSYHFPLAIDIFRTHSLVPSPDRYWHFYFPGNFELWLSTFLSIGRQSANAIAQFPVLFPTAVMAYIFARTLGVSREQSLLTMIVLSSVPIVMFQSITPLNELFSLPFLIGVILYSIEYLKNENRIDAFYAGCSLGLAIGTKYSFLVLLPAIPFALLAGMLLKNNQKGSVIRSWLLFIDAFIVPLIVIPSFWYFRNIFLKGNPFYPLGLKLFGKTIFHGIPTVFDPNFELNFVPSRIHWLIYPWIDVRYSAVQGWGYLAGFVGAAALIIIVLLEFRSESRRHISGFISVFLLLSILLWWRLTQHEPRFLIFVLPFLSVYSVIIFNKFRIPFRLSSLIVLFVFAATMVQAASILKSDVNKLQYDGNFMSFYGLAQEFDEYPQKGNILLFAEGSYGHLLVYPLSGHKFQRRIIVVGLDGITDEISLSDLIAQNKSMLPDSVDKVLYYIPGKEHKIDLTKVMNLKLDGVYGFSSTKSGFVLDNPHKIYTYRLEP